MRRNVWNELVSLKSHGASRLQENLVTLSNIVPLFIVSALACIVAACIFVFECKGQQWRALLTIFLTQTRLGLTKVGDSVRFFVPLIFGYIESQWNNLLFYYSDKIRCISVKKSNNPVILVESSF
jgi:hypothetical protein